MGQTLSEPVTAKETSTCENSFYRVGSSSMQGWRIEMEDAHTQLLALSDDPSATFFGVYDGHGGARVSRYAAAHLHEKISTNALYAEGNIEGAIKRGFLELDEQMLDDEETRQEMSGTTAITVLIKDSTIYCGNVGDSRAVASLNGRALALSNDHKPDNEEETRRIYAADGWVEFNRVNGNLALSRALGDFVFKRNSEKSAEEQIVTAFPEVRTFKITDEFEFVILACDGIWDVLGNQEVVDFCRERLLRNEEPEKICEDLLGHCLAPDCELSGLGCDNMTAILVCLMRNEGREAFVKRLRSRVEVPSLVVLGGQPVRSGECEEVKLDVPALEIDTEESSQPDEQFSTPNMSPHPPDIETSEDEKPPSEFKVLPQSSTQSEKPDETSQAEESQKNKLSE